jgi:hypothetical protein
MFSLKMFDGCLILRGIIIGKPSLFAKMFVISWINFDTNFLWLQNHLLENYFPPKVQNKFFGRIFFVWLSLELLFENGIYFPKRVWFHKALMGKMFVVAKPFPPIQFSTKYFHQKHLPKFWWVSNSFFHCHRKSLIIFQNVRNFLDTFW